MQHTINRNMLQLTKELIEIKSVNSTHGEREIGLFIEQKLREIPYFGLHPKQIIIQKLKEDKLERINVFALLIGEKERKAETLLFHGHTDTVDVKDYGILEELACKPDLLMEAMLAMNLDHEVKGDLLSGDYLFGRGSCDMKAGDAVWIEILREVSKNAEHLSGNILVSFNPVEENLHTGIIEGLDCLKELKETYDLNYILAVNNDFICPLYQGDSTKTVYTGVVGKLLPCFYIQGKETHVGQCFEGFDASMTAMKLVDKIHLNHEFCDGYEGEYTLPPSVLKMKDLKPWYNVQTAKEALVYYNYFVHNASIENITDKLKQAAEEVLFETRDRIDKEARSFSEMNRLPYKEYEYELQVFTYDELYQLAKTSDGFLESRMEELLLSAIERNEDKREIPIHLIRYLLSTAQILSPTIVVYYAAPFCPHNTLQGANKGMLEKVSAIIERVAEKCNETYRIMKFFPSLSDSSYLKIDDTPESVQLLLDNFPEHQKLYPVPVDKIQQLNIPTINYGCYGKDAHRWTERVNISYTFGVLPELIYETIKAFLTFDLSSKSDINME